MQHRLIERGQSSERLVLATSVLTALGLVPLTISLAVGVDVVVDRHFGMLAGMVARAGLGPACGVAWFGRLFYGRSIGEENHAATANVPRNEN